MFIIVGKGCAGKDRVAKELEKRGYHRCITYTTRPMRNSERQDSAYHFVDEDTFSGLRDNEFFAEWMSYKSVEGVWYYGSAKEDYIASDDKTFIILTPNGIRDVKRNLGFSPKVIYLFANNTTIKKRMQMYRSDQKEADRRFKADSIDFKDFELEADRIIYNNFDDDVETVADKIETFLQTSGEV